MNKRRLCGLITFLTGLIMFSAVFYLPDNFIADWVWYVYILFSVLFVISGFSFFFFSSYAELNAELAEKREFEKYYSGKSYITYILIGINILVFIFSEFVNKGIADRYALSSTSIRSGRLYTILTYMFIHGNYQHLLFNMFVLYVEGNKLENLLKRLKFLILYLVSGTMGGLLTVLFNEYPLIGSSGAIYGIIGAMFIIAIINKDKMKYYLNELIVIIIGGLLESIVFRNMSLLTHLFGFVSGILFVMVIGKKKLRFIRKNR